MQEVGIDVGTAPALVTSTLLLRGVDGFAAAYGHPAIQDHRDHGVLEPVLKVGEELRMLP
jgi:hypothetical protein